MSDVTEDERTKGIESAMREAGVQTEQSVQTSYFGFSETHRLTLPDGVSYIDHQTLNEGARKQYLDKVNRDIRIQRATGDAIMKMQQGAEKHVLLEAAIVGWNLVDPDRNPVPYSPRNVKRFLEEGPPKIIDLLEKDINKHNPWLLADLSIEDIDKQIAELEELKETKIKEEEGNAS